MTRKGYHIVCDCGHTAWNSGFIATTNGADRHGAMVRHLLKCGHKSRQTTIKLGWLVRNLGLFQAEKVITNSIKQGIFPGGSERLFDSLPV